MRTFVKILWPLVLNNALNMEIYCQESAESYNCGELFHNRNVSVAGPPTSACKNDVRRGGFGIWINAVWQTADDRLYWWRIVSPTMLRYGVCHWLWWWKQWRQSVNNVGEPFPPPLSDGPEKKAKVKASHTRSRALGPELIPVYRQSARTWL